MIRRLDGGVYLSKEDKLISEAEGSSLYGEKSAARELTMSYQIMRAHCKNKERLQN